MFDRLIDVAMNFWQSLRPFFIVRAYEGGVLLRFGKYCKTLEPGFYWKWPVVDEPIEFNACITTMRLPAQSLTTKDDVTVTVAAIVKYQIVDAKPYALEIWDEHDVLADLTMGAIRKHVGASAYADLLANPPEAEVVAAVRKEVNKFGFKIYAVTFTSFTRARPIMLMTQSVLPNLDN